MNPTLWKAGDIITRDGTDEHEITRIDYRMNMVDVRCVKEPLVAPNETEPWCNLGYADCNPVRRYSFLRRP
jgi:hypothetical protein